MYSTIMKSVVTFAALSVISVMLIKRFVYFQPTHKHLYTMSEGFIDVSAGGLHGWYSSESRTGKVVVVCHGNGGNVSHSTNLIENIQRMGHGVLIFDYPGYGYSPGIPSQKSLYTAVESYVQYLVIDKGIRVSDIVMYGESLGAAVATHAALVFSIPTLIIDSGLPSISRLIGPAGHSIGLGKIFSEFNTEAMLTEYRKRVPDGRVMCMHSENDEIIPHESTDVVRGLSDLYMEVVGTHNSHTVPLVAVNEFCLNTLSHS